MNNRLINIATTCVVVAILLILSACIPTVSVLPATPAPPPTYRVVILGDSISDMTRPYFMQSIDDLFVDAVGGRGVDENYLSIHDMTFRQALPGAIDRVEAGGWFVMQDDGGYEITDEFVALVAETLPDDVGLAWVSPSNVGVPYAAASRQAVRDGIGAQPISVYIDWYTVQQQPGMLGSDNLHPTEAGRQALNHLVWSVTG